MDKISCTRCERRIPPRDTFIRCGCKNYWCSSTCAKSDGFEKGYNEQKVLDTTWNTCKFCRNEDIGDSALLLSALTLLNMTRGELLESVEMSLAERNAPPELGELSLEEF